MKTGDLKTKSHLLVCTHSRTDGKPCCGGKGGAELRQQLKDWIKKSNLKNQIKVTATQCLGHCENGIACYLYPQGKIFTDVELADLDNLKQYIKK